MAKRSPSAPSVSLPEALGRARNIYEVEHRNPMTPEVVAQHMGYKGETGTSLRMIATLRQYGIIDGRGDNIRLSQDAMTAFVDEEIKSEDRAVSLERMFKNPPLFQDISGDFPRIPSLPNLKSFIVKRGFPPTAAGNIAAAYRESAEFVDAELSAYTQHTSSEAEETDMDQQVTAQSVGKGVPLSAVSKNEGLLEIELVRVSKNRAVRLLADGPISKKEMKILADRINASIEAGVYDDAEPEDFSDLA